MDLTYLYSYHQKGSYCDKLIMRNFAKFSEQRSACIRAIHAKYELIPSIQHGDIAKIQRLNK
jgi:hypothetical protein